MEKGFFEVAKTMLSGAGFQTDDNQTFTLNQQGYHKNTEVKTVYIVKLDEQADSVVLTIEQEEWHNSPASKKTERWGPCWWGWKTANDQAYQLRTYLRNSGCNAVFPNVLL